MAHPSSVEQAIMARYGVRLPNTPADTKYRLFKIDQFFNGFLLKTPENAIFGTKIGGETWIYHSNHIESIELEHKENKQIRFEWLIWHAARAIIGKGERLSTGDGERLALAVKRLEEWL